MGAFDQLVSLFADELFVPGAWFALSENEIYTDSNRKRYFANKDGVRPCLLGSSPGPNQLVFARSATLSLGTVAHAKHVHPGETGRCLVNKNGFVVRTPVVVSPELINSENYRCREPDGSVVLNLLLSASRII